MATGTYYINGPDLESATAVFTDSAMTICAADGFYQQNGIVREQVDCVLLPQVTCASCAFPCDVTIADNNIYGYSSFKSSIDLGSGTGAVILTFNVDDIPDGVMVIYNSVVYNKLSSPTYGYLAAPAGNATFIGKASEDCGLVQIFPWALAIFRYNGHGFDITSDSENVYVIPADLQLTTNNPGDCVMVIPKTTAEPSVMEITVLTICESSAFEFTVDCPANLPGFSCTARYATSAEACAISEINIRYSAPVNGNGTILGLYDWVFSDVNGQNVLADGYYHSPDAIPVFGDGYFRVANGVIIEFGDCI